MASLAPLAVSFLFAAAPVTPELKTFDRFDSTFFNQSVETVVLDKLELKSMEHLGLDPNDADDYRLFAFIFHGFHYRYVAVQSADDQADLGVYVYNVKSVPIGQPIPVLDASVLETVHRDQLRATLHALFDPIRKSGEPRVIVAYSRSRKDENPLRRMFINVFAEQRQFATSGEARFTRAADRDGGLTTLSHPLSSLTELAFTFDGQRDGRRWHVEPGSTPVKLSGKPKK